MCIRDSLRSLFPSPRLCVQIADFGLARHLPQGSLAESMLGSPLYMAPEVLGNRACELETGVPLCDPLPLLNNQFAIPHSAQSSIATLNTLSFDLPAFCFEFSIQLLYFCTALIFAYVLLVYPCVLVLSDVLMFS